jgi:hypothetical protein
VDRIRRWYENYAVEQNLGKLHVQTITNCSFAQYSLKFHDFQEKLFDCNVFDDCARLQIKNCSIGKNSSAMLRYEPKIVRSHSFSSTLMPHADAPTSHTRIPRQNFALDALQHAHHPRSQDVFGSSAHLASTEALFNAFVCVGSVRRLSVSHAFIDRAATAAFRMFASRQALMSPRVFSCAKSRTNTFVSSPIITRMLRVRRRLGSSPRSTPVLRASSRCP